MAKDIILGESAREKLISGAEILTQAVQSTLGPKGRNVVLEKSFGAPRITKDGVSVAKDIELKDKALNQGAQMLKEATSKAADNAGDGTTTATVLAYNILTSSNKYIVAGANPNDLKKGINFAVEEIVKQLKSNSKKVNNKSEVAQVGTISANGDKEVGDKIAEAMEKVGHEGVITVEESNTNNFDVDVVKGMRFDRGYISPYFITNNEKGTVEMDNPAILIVDKKISSLNDIIHILEKVNQSSKPLLIIAEDVEGQALATLIVNKLRINMNVAVVKSPGFGDRKKEMMEDIAILTSTQVVSKDLDMELKSFPFEALGSAKKVIITKDHTTIVEGSAKKADIETRCAQIKSEISNSSSDYDKEKLQERLAKLTSGVAVLKVGGLTEIELKERKDRVEDALHATRAAVEEGIVTGGGMALFYAAKSLKSQNNFNEDQNYGIKVVQDACSAPLKQIVKNAGETAEVIIQSINSHNKDSLDIEYGFDAQNMDFGNMFTLGIVDPVKVVRNAIQSAASVASLIASTNCLIIDEEKEDNNPGMPGAGGMGMNPAMGGF